MRQALEQALAAMQPFAIHSSSEQTIDIRVFTADVNKLRAAIAAAESAIAAPAAEPLTDECLIAMWGLHPDMPQSVMLHMQRRILEFARAVERAHHIE